MAPSSTNLAMVNFACFVSLRRMVAALTLTILVIVDAHAQHRIMSDVAQLLDTALHHQGFFATSSWLIQASGALGAVTPPSGTYDEAELSNYPARDQAWVLTTSEQVSLYTFASKLSIDLRC